MSLKKETNIYEKRRFHVADIWRLIRYSKWCLLSLFRVMSYKKETDIYEQRRFHVADIRLFM